jgi:hypothetical protein
MPLSDILSCPVDQLEEVVSQENPYERGTWFFAKRIGMIELSQLGKILGIGTYDDLKAGFQLVGEPLPEGPWPQTIPPDLVTALGSLTDEHIESVCPEWAEIEELSVSPEGLAQYLTNLRDFLRANTGPFFLVNAL